MNRLLHREIGLGLAVLYCITVIATFEGTAEVAGWSAAGTLSTARYDHTATLLADRQGTGCGWGE